MPKNPTTSTASADPDPDPSIGVAVQNVHLCDRDRKLLFMLEVPNRVYGACDRCDTFLLLYQYPRPDVRLAHLSAADRDAFNAKLDAIAARDESAAKERAQVAAADAAAAEARQATIVAENDRLYQIAVDERHAIEAEAEAAIQPQLQPQPQSNPKENHS